MDDKNSAEKSSEGNLSSESNSAAVLQRIIADLTPLSPPLRQRMLDTVSMFFGMHPVRNQAEPPSASGPTIHNVPSASPGFRFSEKEVPTPKQFMLEKAPQTDVEKVACLAYYLTHYRATPHLKAKDITDLNTEAAQRRFSNAHLTVGNAAQGGFLVPSIKGCRQLSGAGEQFVQALPDREAAREAMRRMKPRRFVKRTRSVEDKSGGE